VNTLLRVLAAIGVLIVIGIVLLWLGGALSRRTANQNARLWTTLHLLAFLAAIVGGVLAWMAFDSDHPNKWKHLALPAIFVAIVYGYAIYRDPVLHVKPGTATGGLPCLPRSFLGKLTTHIAVTSSRSGSLACWYS
jgi:hypothetical protein